MVTVPADASDLVTRQFLLDADSAEWLRVFAYLRETSQSAVVRDALEHLIAAYDADPELAPQPAAKATEPKNFQVTQAQARWLYDQAFHRRTSQAKLVREAIRLLQERVGG